MNYSMLFLLTFLIHPRYIDNPLNYKKARVLFFKFTQLLIHVATVWYLKFKFKSLSNNSTINFQPQSNPKVFFKAFIKQTFVSLTGKIRSPFAFQSSLKRHKLFHYWKILKSLMIHKKIVFCKKSGTFFW